MPISEHHHHHHHDVAHGQGHEYTEANKAYFNSSDLVTELEDHPVFVEFANTVGAAMRDTYPFDSNSSTALDFACGTGLSTRSYAPYVKSVLGVDISQKVLDQYIRQAHAKGLSDKMSCVCTELKGVEGELDGAKFDVVTCVMAYHHFGSVTEITSILVRFLKPNGMLVVVDIEAPTIPDKPPTDVNSSVVEGLQDLDHVAHKRGFKVAEMKELFEGAGLVSFDMKHLTHVKVEGKFEVDTFLARGSRPVEK